MIAPRLPSTLFKFLADAVSSSDNRVPFVQTDRLIRFSQPNSFNDPFEALPIWSLDGITNDIIDRFFVGNTPHQRSLPFDKARKFRAIKRALVKRMARENPDRLKRILTDGANRVASFDTGVLSLSASFEAGPMWAHYSNNHEGLCIGFDTSHRFFEHRMDNLVFRVEYVRKRPVVAISKLADATIGDAIYEKKDERWKYEEEYRIVRGSASATCCVGNDKRGYPIHLFQVPAECVTQIIVGLRATNSVKAAASNWKDEHPHTQILQALIAKDSFSIVHEPLKL